MLACGTFQQPFLSLTLTFQESPPMTDGALLRPASRGQRQRGVESRIYRHAIGAAPDPIWKSLLCLFTEPGFAMRILRKRLRLATPIYTEDRRVLEDVIFERFRSDRGLRTALFVGVDSYTAHYPRYFAHLDFWTLDPNPEMARFGGRQHLVAPLEQLADHFPSGYFDLIICNGVYGWGLDARAQCEAAFAHCHECLAPAGHLVVGWNDIPERRPVPFNQLASLQELQKCAFPPLGSWRFETDTPYRHTFDFYRRPAEPISLARHVSVRRRAFLPDESSTYVTNGAR
jgi:SAM-dependent methyltransferase